MCHIRKPCYILLEIQEILIKWVVFVYQVANHALYNVYILLSNGFMIQKCSSGFLVVSLISWL